MPPSPRITPDDLRDITAGVSDLVGEIRRLSEKTGDVSGDIRALQASVTTLSATVARVEAHQQSGHVIRVLGTLERAPWQVGALLASIILVLVLMAGHVDLIALTAAYGQPRTP